MKKEDRLEKLIDHLILYCSNTIDNGLYHGKMGLLICLYEYARYVKDDIYLELADCLLEEVFEEMSTETPINFKSGLCGIGWGIEYLICHEYVDGNADEILEELDDRIMQMDITRIKDFEIETGLGGIAYYVSSRIKAADRTTDAKVPFDITYIEKWKEHLPVCLSSRQLSDELKGIYSHLQSILCILPDVKKQCIDFPSFIPLTDYSKIPSIEDLRLFPKGLDGGIAGLILKIVKR